MNKTLLSFSLLLLILGSCNQVNETSTAQIPAEKTKTAATFENLTSQQAKHILTQQPEITILDVRTSSEFAGGHLQNAANLDYNAPNFAGLLEKLDKSKPYLVYCAVGGRSGKATQLMQEMGFTQIYNAAEGFPELKRAGVAVSM
jgi:rhodanese-related sulfurtransferase